MQFGIQDNNEYSIHYQWPLLNQRWQTAKKDLGDAVSLSFHRVSCSK